MKDEIEELQRYLLNPKDAVKDSFSYFDSLTYLLEADEKKDKKIYELFIAVFKAFLEPYETEEFCYRIPLVNGELQYKDKILIHKYFYDKKSNEIKINKDTRSEWIRLSNEFNALEEKNINTEYNLVSARKYYYYIDNKIGLNVGMISLKQLRDEALKTDSEYLQDSYRHNLNKLSNLRFELWKDIKLYTNNFESRAKDLSEEDLYKPDTPINNLCELFNKKEFTFKKGVDLNRYLESLQSKFSIPEQICKDKTEESEEKGRGTPLKVSTNTEPQVLEEDKRGSLQLGFLNSNQTYKLYEACNRIIFEYTTLEEFVSSLTNYQDQKLTVKNKNLFLIFVYYWFEIFKEEVFESDIIGSINNITIEYLKKKKITDKTPKTEKQIDLSKKLKEFL